jgi:competence protein ComEC
MSEKLPDLRLAVPSVACWLSAIWALNLPASGGVIVATAAAVGAVVCAWLARSGVGRRSGSALWWLLAGAMLGVLCGAASTAARVSGRDAEPLAGWARSGASVSADLVVGDDPRPARGTAGPPVYIVVADLTRIRHDDVVVRVSARVLVLASDSHWRALLPGQHVTVEGWLGKPRPGDLRAAVLLVTTPPTWVGAAPWVQRAAGRLRDGLQRACAPLPREPGGLLPGLVDGDTSRLEPAVMDDFTTTGMTHLVAVSGANVG